MCPISRFTADILLHMRWRDLRLTLRDLNHVPSMNPMDADDLDTIWSPKLTFANALGPLETVVDGLATAVLIRESDPLPEDPASGTEG